jgi:tetratricopeptide (TPR) repeat protein
VVKDYCVLISLNPRLNQADLTGLRKDLLAAAARFHEKFKDVEGDDPEVRAERAQAYFELAFIAKETGSTKEAIGYYQQSLALWRALVDDHSGNRDYKLGLAQCYNDMASSTLVGSENVEATYRKSLALKQELARAAPDDRKLQNELALVQGNLTLWYIDKERFKEAEVLLEEALKPLQALADPHRGTAEDRHHLARLHNQLGYVYSQTNRHAQAGKAYQQALAVSQQLHEGMRNHLRYQEDLGWSYKNLGDWYRADGKPKEAEKSYQLAVDTFRNLADNHPSVLRYQRHLAGSLKKLGLFYQANGQTEKALKAYQDCLKIEEGVCKLDPADLLYAVGLAGSYCNMGLRLSQNGEPQAALPWFDKAQAKLEEVRQRDKDNPRARTFLRNTHRNRAQALLELERPADALKEWDLALALDRTDADRANSRTGRALALVRLGKYEEAVTIAEEVVGRPGAETYGLYRAARVFSLASVAVAQDSRRDAAERRKLAEQYSASAVAQLRRLQALGDFKNPGNVAYLKRNADFDPLRSRADFKALLGELEK